MTIHPEAKLFTVGSCDAISAASHHMQQFRINHLPVMKGEELVGIVSDRDVKSGLIIEKEHDIQLYVKDIMQSPVQTINHDSTLIEAINLLVSNRIHSAVVIKDDKPLNIVTSTDLILILKLTLEKPDTSLKEIFGGVGYQGDNLIDILDAVRFQSLATP